MKNLLTYIFLFVSTLSLAQVNSGNKDIMLDYINNYRVENGLEELKYDSIVEKAAFLQALDNYKNDKGGHINTNLNLETVEDRLEFVGYESVFGYYWCENAGRIYDYLNQESVEKILFNSWKESKGHNLNMLNKYVTKIGYYLINDSNENFYAIVVFSE